MTDSHEFPGFHQSDTPLFTDARGATMFAGTLPEPTAVLDLAMVFGSRLWGHDLATLNATTLGAPGLGDLHTHDSRERACTALCERVGQELHHDDAELRALVLHTGSEAVETALKTALRATGRTQMVAFEGAYHGTFGLAMAVTHSSEFRRPWKAQLGDTVTWAEWGTVPALTHETACVVVEPWQGRAGVLPPPDGFLSLLRDECDRVGALLVLDAVLCGSGRTGAVLVESVQQAQPDLICLGKALGCGYAASAVVARADIARAAWDVGRSEPAHTSTMLGDPVATTGVLRTLDYLTHRADELQDAGDAWQACLTQVAADCELELRGIGLLWALDTNTPGHGVDLARRLLTEQRVLVVPSGHAGSSITLYPSIACDEIDRHRFVHALLDAYA